jgi:hypothetical protein
VALTGKNSILGHSAAVVSKGDRISLQDGFLLTDEAFRSFFRLFVQSVGFSQMTNPARDTGEE